jgi:hypothetical protein
VVNTVRLFRTCKSFIVTAGIIHTAYLRHIEFGLWLHCSGLKKYLQ